jgi:hypothetical protein
VVSTPLEFTKSYQDGLITAVNAKLFEQGIGLQLHRGRFDASEAIKFVGSNTWVKRLQSMINVLNSIDDK